MQDIIASLSERVLNFKDIKGKTIIDFEFDPFNAYCRRDIEYMNEEDHIMLRKISGHGGYETDRRKSSRSH